MEAKEWKQKSGSKRIEKRTQVRNIKVVLGSLIPDFI